MNGSSKYRFSCGPWCFDVGRDPFGPPVRAPFSFQEVLQLCVELGYEGIELHDDDVVQDLDNVMPSSIEKRAREVKAVIEDHGMQTAFIAPRLWEDSRTIDGAVTANNKKSREYALDRSKKAIDIAGVMGTRKIVFFLGREGTSIRESKDAKECIGLIVEHIDRLLEYDSTILVLGETKPNEPMDQIFSPTPGHFIGIAYRTAAPSRVGVSIETAHCGMLGCDPTDEIGYALWHDKLWGLHLDDQSGPKFNEHRTFGAINIRQALNVVSLLDRHGYANQGAFVGIETRPLRTQSREKAVEHLRNSKRIFLSLVQTSRSISDSKVSQFKSELDYEGLEMYILEKLLQLKI